LATLHITLEQWRVLVAVVDAGGYTQAAELLHKSQSSVTYAVQKLQAVLGVKAFEVQGRKAVLTPTGQLLYRRARALLDDAGGIEKAARTLSAGWEAEIRLAVEMTFPTGLILKCLARFGEVSPQTRIELIESVLGGTQEALLTGQADLAIAGSVPQGFTGVALTRMRLCLAAHPEHPLARLGRPVTLQDLRQHRHLVVRETSLQRGTPPSLEALQRWTVSSMSTSIIAARAGYGYAWLPEEKIRDEVQAGLLAPLEVRDGGARYAQLYLIYADRDAAGQGTVKLSEIIQEIVESECSRQEPQAASAR